MNLSEHFTLEEFAFSQTAVRKGIDNSPMSQIVLAHLKGTAQRMEDVRNLLSRPIRITSGYRTPELNRAIGGAKHSHHMDGWAADFICPSYGKPIDIVRAIAESDIQFDQLIQEGTWVHISFAPTMRREVLTAHFWPSGTTYTQGISESMRS